MKKIIIIFAILVAGIASAQSQTCKYAVNKIDEFTGEITQAVYETIIGEYEEHGFIFASISRIGNYRAIGFRYFGSLGCVSKNSYVIFKFENGQVLKIMNSGKIECKSGAMMILMLSETELELLKSNPVDKVRVSGTEKTIDVVVELKNYFVNSLPCLD